MVRNTYRAHNGNSEYWDHRWSNTPVDLNAINTDKYPGKYSQEIMDQTDGALLEAGCGMGRNVIFCHDLGREIIGIEYSQIAVDQVLEQRPDLDVRQADIMKLPFDDKTFAGVMAFGLYHNFEHGCDDALNESLRVMQPGGYLVASVRINNFANKINDLIEDKKYQIAKDLSFHKANYSENEYRKLLLKAGFEIERMEYCENMPLLYKFKIFRHSAHKEFNEQRGRADGYRLNWLADKAQRFLYWVSPRSFCNIIVVIARRPS